MHTILIVEDDPAIAEMLQTVLQDEGYDVVTAYDGVDAQERLVQRRCDLILADLMMPRLDGRELRAALAAQPDYRHVPMVLMTAASNLVAGDQRDFAALLPKPFHLDTLLDLLERLLAPPAHKP